MRNEAIILAGGFGTRLATVVPDRPKPMADINGTPFLEYLLNYLLSQKIAHIILAVGYKSEMIISFFGRSYKGMKLSYAIEDKPLGTGGAIKNALYLTTSREVFILNGDTYFPVPLKLLEKEKHRHHARLVMALSNTDDASRFGTVILNQGSRIIKFEEKQGTKGPGLINGGIYLIDSNIFNGTAFPEKFSFEEDFLKNEITTKTIYGHVFNEYFIDIGIPETYLRLKDKIVNWR